MTFDIALFVDQPNHGSTQAWHALSRDHTVLADTHAFIHHTCFCLRSWSWSSFTTPEGMEGWVGLGTTIVIKQSAQDRYVMEVALLAGQTSCASLGSWSAVAKSIESLTAWTTSNDANHWTTESEEAWNVSCLGDINGSEGRLWLSG